MPQLTRMYCSNCGNSIYNTFISKTTGLRAAETDPGAVRVPLVLYFVVGKPDDTGPDMSPNDDGVKLPSFIREFMQPHVPVQRAELCMICVADVFGVAMVTASEDPMYSGAQQELNAVAAQAIIGNGDVSAVQKHQSIVQRTFLALKVGRGAAEAPPLLAVGPARSP